MKVQDFDPVTMVFRDCAIYRTARRGIERLSVAATDSVLLAPLRTAKLRPAQSSAGNTLALAAVTLAWAAVAHLAMRSLLPRYATSGLPWWWNVVVAAFAVLTAAFAPAIAAAWRGSAPQRLWRGSE